MAQSKDGSEKVAAKRCGVTVDEYRRQLAMGCKFCYACRLWKVKEDFGADTTRYDRLSAICGQCRRRKSKAKYTKKGRVSKAGQRFTAARDGDKEQARYRVNHLIKLGRLANPNTLPCFDCGHLGKDRRHEYDHFEGYSAAKQECVQAVCSKCHARRARDRGEIVQTKDRTGKFTKKGGS